MKPIKPVHVRDNVYWIYTDTVASRQKWGMAWDSGSRTIRNMALRSRPVHAASLAYMRAALEEAETLLQTRFAVAVLLSFLGGLGSVALLAFASFPSTLA